jgi:hypothetical protein
MGRVKGGKARLRACVGVVGLGVQEGGRCLVKAMMGSLQRCARGRQTLRAWLASEEGRRSDVRLHGARAAQP